MMNSTVASDSSDIPALEAAWAEKAEENQETVAKRAVASVFTGGSVGGLIYGLGGSPVLAIPVGLGLACVGSFAALCMKNPFGGAPMYQIAWSKAGQAMARAGRCLGFKADVYDMRGDPNLDSHASDDALLLQLPVDRPVLQLVADMDGETNA